LRPVFSRNSIWPISPGRVALWANRHGQLQALAPADWPRRTVETDAGLLAAARRKGLNHAATLHLLTAAIGVDDRRIRVLIDAEGAILGPRAYSRPRLAIAGALVATALLGAVWDQLPPTLKSPSTAPALAEAAASAAVSAASATAPPAPQALALAASAPAAAPAPAEPAAAEDHHSPQSAPAPMAATDALADAPGPWQATGAGHDAPPPQRDDAAAKPPPEARDPHAGAAQPTQAAAAIAALGPAANGDPPAATPLGRIRPPLSAEDRLAARQQSAALRAAPLPRHAPAKPDAPPRSEPAALASTIYAVVTRPDRQREVAANSLAAMRSAAAKLPPPVPSNGELMQNQGSWRAAWWPFVSLADAERARVMLARKGVKTEVVEF